MRGIQTEKAISNNGSLDVLNASNQNISRVLALDGTKHNFVTGAATVEDCIALGNDAPIEGDTGTNAFTAFMENAGGQTASYKRCGLVNVQGGGFYAHGNPNFDSIALEQFWYIGNSSGLYVGGANNVGMFAKDVIAVMGEDESMAMYLLPSLVSTQATMSGLHANCVWSASRSGAYDNTMANGGATFQNCAFFGLGSTGSSVYSNGDSNTGTWNYSIFYNVVNTYISTLAGYSGDYNVFMGGSVLGDGSVFFMRKASSALASTLKDWQTASGSDANSVYLLISEQDAGDSTAFWLAYKDAAPGTDKTTIGPHVGDFRVNPNAKVYGAPFTGATPTTYTGTFANGATISLAGPQQHWDWNARAAASGPPTAWPEPPDTKAESQTYIADPEAWEFYPTSGAVAEITSITCVGDVAGSLNGKYFVIYDNAGSVAVWMNTGGGSAPGGYDRTLEVAIMMDDNNEGVASDVSAVLNADAAFSAANYFEGIIVSAATTGSRVDAADVDTGFTITTPVQGN